MGNSGNELSAKPKFKDTASPSGSSKRARAISNGTVTASCLVDGCNSDLSNCRDYHRRHKVCELHSKTPEVTIGGLKQRFCQQCSRFHSLEQFDEGKRSCRKRLDGHNRRRRKAQPEPLTRPGSFLSNYQGTQLLPFSRPHAYPSTTVVNPGWSGGRLVTTSCSDARMHNHNQHQQVQLVEKHDLFLGSSPTSYKQVKQLAFLPGENPSTATFFNNQNPPLPVSSVCSHTLLRTNSLSESGDVRSKIFCDSLTTSVHDSPCALSLLSSSQTHTPGNGINQMVQPAHSMSLMQLQPLGLSLHDSSLESVERVLVPNGSDHCSSMYNMVSDESQGNEAPQLFPFQWQ